MTGDEYWMSRALALAEEGRGAVEPNPLVGAVVVRDGVAVGEGWHERFGGPHAEINAMAAAGEAARGTTLYVTLEPCCHHGKTPPCTDAIVAAGINRVVTAMPDPFQEVAGRGVEALRSAGIAVDVGICEAAARDLNRPYLTLLRLGRPYVHAKWAMSLDGKIATRTGQSKWLTGRPTRERVHQLRGRMDAVIVGAGTVRADDPLLTVRPAGRRTPVRIVLAGSRPIADNCRLLQTLDEAPVLIAKAKASGCLVPDPRCEILDLPAEDGRPIVGELLRELGRRRMTNVLIEGGAAVFGSFRDADLLDELHVFVAPKLVGGAAAPSPVAGIGLAAVDEGSKPVVSHWEHIGEDLYVNAQFPSADEPS
jgi:diaminohydroxyphosphoribosylaminopyrimidine deaminase/5-amino-6-(5-phosphoribosylamino)uracil reductase